MANSANIPVFLETSLDTFLVVGVSSDDTVESLKRKIVATHPVNFPDTGKIIVQAVKTCQQGKMYHLSDLMTVSTLLNGINETLLLYVEAVADKRERNLINGKVDEELEVPVRRKIEEMMVNELPHTDKEISVGLHHDLAEAPAHKLNRTEKKRRRKVSAIDTSVSLIESREGEDGMFEGNFVYEEPDNGKLLEANILNLVEHTTTEKLTSDAIRLYQNEEADNPKCNAQANGDSDFHDLPDTSQVSNQGTIENGFPTKVPNQSGMSYDVAELLEENARKDDTDKAQPPQQATQMVIAVLGGVAQEKKNHKKTKGFSSDVPSEVPPIREFQPQVEDNLQISAEKDSHVPQKPGCTTETPNSIPSWHFRSSEEQEGGSRAEKDILSENQPHNVRIAVANDMEECRLHDARKDVLKESTHVVQEDHGVVFGVKKKHKKSKAIITEVSTKELSYRENEFSKEKANNSVLEKETSEAGAALFINSTVLSGNETAPSRVTAGSPNLKVSANSTVEAVEEISKKRRKKTKVSSPDMPSDVLPIGEDSEKAGVMAEADDSVPCQLEKERLEPEISLPADKDIRFHNQLGIQKTAMADNNEDLGKETQVIKNAHVVGEDPGVSSLEKRRRKKKKTEQLADEAANESGQVERNDLILEQEIAKEAVDADLTKIAGEDHGVASKGKRKRNKTKATSTDMPSQELSALESDFSKEGESKLMQQKKTFKEADNTRFPKNADDVAFLAPSSADPEDSINIISDILADLKRSPTQPDGQIDVAPQMQLLANLAVDQHKAEQYHGIVVEGKEEIKSGKKSSNKTKTLRNTMNLLTGVSVIAHDEEKTHETEEATSTIQDNVVGNRDTFILATLEDGARNQTLDSNMAENSVGDGKKKRRRKQEATNSRSKATIDGATDEANGSIKNSMPETDASGKKVPRTKIQKSLKEDNVPANLSSGDKKSSKGKSKEKGLAEKLSDASLGDETIKNAPNTPEKVQKSGDNLRAENHDKEACIEAVETKGTEVLHAPTIEKINFVDYFLHKGADQPADTKIAALKETKGSKKIENSAFSKDSMSASVDTRVHSKTKKAAGKLQTTEKLAKSFKEHNPSGTSNDMPRVHTTMGDDGPKKDDNMNRLLDDMAVMSDFSTDDEEEVRSQVRRPMVAVRKVASKVIGEKMDASRKTAAVSSSGLPDGVGSDASTRDDSGSANRGSPIPGKDRGRAMMSPSSRWKNERVADDDMPMSQELTMQKKTLDLSSVLRSSASYKKAKISLSQSHAEDHDMIDMVCESPQDLAS